jgi:hypothetical protein
MKLLCDEQRAAWVLVNGTAQVGWIIFSASEGQYAPPPPTWHRGDVRVARDLSLANADDHSTATKLRVRRVPIGTTPTQQQTHPCIAVIFSLSRSLASRSTRATSRMLRDFVVTSSP